MSKPVQQTLHCKWDNNKDGAHGGQSPCGCIFQRPLSTIAVISHNLSSEENSKSSFFPISLQSKLTNKKHSFCEWSSCTDSAARRGSNMSSSESWSHRQKNPQQSIAWCICRLILHSFCKVIQHPQQCCHHWTASKFPVHLTHMHYWHDLAKLALLFLCTRASARGRK